MNLDLSRKILVAAEKRREGFLRVRGRHLVREVELMQDAGLVEVSALVNNDAAIAVINRVTEVGRRFLRVVGDRATSAVIGNAFAPSRPIGLNFGA